MEISLREMKKNQKGIIVSVHCEGELRQRINDMGGLTPGAEVRVVGGRAPLKDPVALKVRGFTISLRNNEADHITVKVEG